MPQSLRKFNIREGWLLTSAFAVLIGFSLLSIGTWRWPNTSFISVHAGSLTPLIQPGDAVITNPVKLARLQPGDIASYYNPQDLTQIVTARVRQIIPNQRAVNFESSNNDVDSETVSQSLLIGKVQSRLAKVGYVLDFVRSRIGLVIAVYIPAFIIVGNELKLLTKNFDRKVYRLFGATVGRP